MRIETVPDFLAIGHATRDLLADESAGWRLGGTVTFAALTAARLGLQAAIVTSGPADVLATLQQTLPGVALHAVPAPEATSYQNIYEDGHRRQYLRGRAARLTVDAIPPTWRKAPIIVLAPLADELDVGMVEALASPNTLLAATPQGWLRRWDEAGYVTPQPFVAAPHILPHLRALILSREDVLLPENSVAPGDELPQTSAQADALLASWAQQVPLMAVTSGPEGALFYQQGTVPELFPGYPAHEVDPTGAGDVFAAAFLCQLHQTNDARVAMDFANRVAACSVEQIGVAGVPTREQVVRRFASRVENDQ